MCNTMGCITFNAPNSKPVVTENGKVEKVVKNFITAYNKSDIDAMLNYIDPSEAKGIRAAIDLAGGLLGEIIGYKINMKDVLNFIPLFATLAGDSNYSQMTIKEMTSDVDGDTANVYVEIEYNSNGNTQKATSAFGLENIYDDWYIINFK